MCLDGRRFSRPRIAATDLYTKKSREGIKSTLCIIHDAAMFFRYLPIGRNPMELVKVPIVKAAPKIKAAHLLRRDEFRLLLARFVGMYRVKILLAAVSGCGEAKSSVSSGPTSTGCCVKSSSRGVTLKATRTKRKLSLPTLVCHCPRRLWRRCWRGVSNQHSTQTITKCSPVRS